MDIGKIGVWWTGEDLGASAAVLEDLGFGTLWLPGGVGGNVLDRSRVALSATGRIVVASSIVNVWEFEATELAGRAAELGERFMLGLGIGHREGVGAEWQKPVEKMASFLDDLDAAGHPRDMRAIAAHRPKMLELAATRTAGALPYLVTVDHIAAARAQIGTGPVIAPVVNLAFERDPAVARDLARQYFHHYLLLHNYVNNLRHVGFTDEDLALPGSDRLADAVVGWGSPDDLTARVHQYFDAGADHVSIQVIGADGAIAPVERWRQIAGMLL